MLPAHRSAAKYCRAHGGAGAEAPHVTSVAEADLTAIARFRDARKAAFREAKGTALTFLPFVVKATARLLPEFPI